MVQQLIMTRGLPASGKTTFALAAVEKSNGQLKRINKDSLRSMVDGGAWSKAREKLIVKMRNVLVEEALANGYSVIVDDTNLSDNHAVNLQRIANNFGAMFVLKDFTHVSLEECLKRDQKRSNYVGEAVIKRMWKESLAPKPLPRSYDPQKLDCIIVDIDGTLADMNGRNPYDASTCENDLPRHHVIELIRCIRLARVLYTVVVSGREDTYREQTERWLTQYLGNYNFLFMRPGGDGRADTIIKQEIFEREIEPNYNVKWVIDDRPTVIRMWKSLGLPVLDVGHGVEF